MARPKTKSDPIAIRLSLPAYEAAQLRASAAGLSIREWAEQAMEKALAPPDPGRASPRTTPRHTDAMTRAAQQAATAKLTRPAVEPRFKQ